ncbi:MAG: alpha/beta hydrolase, partial [Bacillota bacterium]|nr:alpha/beta hydrolase [Bacillota bacterium]
MNYDLNQLEFRMEGEGRPLLFLHGWGRNLDAFAPIISQLPDEYKIITLSLPGFGNSPEPAKAWTVEEYAALVTAFLNEKLTPEERAQLLCVTHSYGGRLAGKIRSFRKLVQIAAAGIKPKRSLKYRFGLFCYKVLKASAAIPIIGCAFKRPHIAYRNLRSSDDYKNASPVMKEALNFAVNHDQKKDFAKITCPTLLIWGDADVTTPLWMGRTMEKLIEDSALIVYPNATHQVLTERASEIAVVIDDFFKQPEP